MTSANFDFEKTYIGMQDVIPGTERPAKPKRRIYNTDGYQLVLPGAERISTSEYLARLAGKPLMARRGQIGLRGMELIG